MSAINQMFVGLFGAVSGAVSGITKLINKWYPVYTRDVSQTGQVRWLEGKAWSFVTGQGVATSENGVDWVTIWPTANLEIPGNVSLNDIAYGAGLYVIVGGVVSGGTALILTSSDGTNWTRQNTSNTVGFNSIAWSPTLNLFLAAGSNGTTAYSSNGISWTAGVSAGTSTITKVVWGGNQFALMNSNGSSSSVYRSTNGTSFTVQSTGLGFALVDIDYSPSLGLWALTRQSANTAYVMTSPDLNVWTARTLTGASSGNGVVWNGSNFVVSSNGNGVASSSDGITWTRVNTNISQLGKMCATPSGTLIAVTFNDKGRAISYNSGVTWGTSITEVDTVVGQFRSNATKAINAITHSGGRYWIAASNVSGQLFYSTDKKVWFSTAMPISTTGTSYRAVYAGSAAIPYWVSPGTTSTAGRVFTSTDGDSWTLRTVATQGTSWNDAATNGTTVVMVNNGGQIASTADGITFTNRTSGTTAALRSVVYAAGKFVAIGASVALYSTDGVTWSAATASYGAFNGAKLIHTGTQFVAVGTGTATVNTKVSTDGVTWATGPVAPWGTTSISSLAHNGSVFVAMTTAASNRTVYVGASMSALSAVSLPIAITPATNGLVAVGSEFTLQSNHNAFQLTSVDNGATWTSWSTAEPIGSSTLSSASNALGMLDNDIAFFVPYNGSYNTGLGKYNQESKTFNKLPVNPAAGILSTYSITKVGSKYIAGLGNGTTSGNISTSTDLGTWVTRLSPAATVRSIAVSSTGARLVAGTHSGTNTGQLGAYSSIDNGDSWVSISVHVNYNVAKVLNAAGNFVFVGYNSSGIGKITVKTEGGFDYIGEFTGPAGMQFTDVAYGNGMYVAVATGSGSKIYSSPDGITWTARGQTTFVSLNSIAFGDGVFWALGANGEGYTSTDGANWVSKNISFNNMVGLTWDGVDSFWAMNSRGSLYKYTPQ